MQYLVPFLLFVSVSRINAAPDNKTGANTAASWNRVAAAQYLDSREAWWQAWPVAQRDHGTICLSCHTVLPYALSRPALRADLSEQEPTSAERTMLGAIEKRVTLWDQVEPFYTGPGISAESRATESVLNAVILSSYDAQQGRLRAITRKAFDAAWALQLQSGEQAGAWKWQVFDLAPWESRESQYHGAALFALGLGMAPDHYSDDSKIRAKLQLLRAYLQRAYSAQPLLNRIVLLWASAKLPGLLSAEQRGALVSSVLSKQHEDGGWSLTDLGTWERSDIRRFARSLMYGSVLETKSDGYATGLVVLALEETGVARGQIQLKRGLAWLTENQDKNEGFWRAYSLNKKRDLTTDVGRFMTDAATGYAVLALENSRSFNELATPQHKAAATGSKSPTRFTRVSLPRESHLR